MGEKSMAEEQQSNGGNQNQDQGQKPAEGPPTVNEQWEFSHGSKQGHGNYYPTSDPTSERGNKPSGGSGDGNKNDGK